MTTRASNDGEPGPGAAGGASVPGSAAAPKSNAKRRLFLVVAAVVFPLVLAEIAGRVLLVATSRTMDDVRFDPESFHHKIYREHPYTVYALAAGTRRTEGGVEYVVNAHGYRGPDAPLEKPSGETRIACVGGSTTFGTGLAEDDTYPRRLESRLRTRFPARQTSVVNAGVPGFTSAETLVNVALRILDLAPDYVVVLENVNEMSPRRWPGFAADYSHYRRPWTRPEPSFPGAFLERVSAFYCLARFHLTDYRWCRYVEFYCTKDFATNWTGPPVDLSPSTLAPFRERLARLCRFSRVSGARPVLCTMAHRGRPDLDDPVFARLMEQQNGAIREVARAEGALLADFDAKMTGDGEAFSDAVHVRPAGAVRMAAIVAGAIASDGTWGEPLPPRRAGVIRK